MGIAGVFGCPVRVSARLSKGGKGDRTHHLEFPSVIGRILWSRERADEMKGVVFYEINVDMRNLVILAICVGEHQLASASGEREHMGRHSTDLRSLCSRGEVERP